MIDFDAIKKSNERFENARLYFGEKQLKNCIIEISDKPMREWEIWYSKESIKIQELSASCWHNEIPNITIISNGLSNNSYLYYEDGVVAKGIDLRTGQIYLDEILQKREFSLIQIAKEFKSLVQDLKSK
jgi:hypothetical protein